MNEEEKEAVEQLKKLLNDFDNEDISENDLFFINRFIEKQQKEIEELKKYKHDVELTKVSCCTAQNCEALNNCIKLRRELQNADKKIQKQQKEIKELKWKESEQKNLLKHKTNKIDKQQKEIEELNIALMTASLKIEGLKIEAVYNDNYISKDKIREIKEKILFTLKKGENVPVWKITIIDNFFKELLEED